MKPELVRTQDKCLLKLKGEFTIQRMKEIQAALVEAFEGSQTIEISLEEVTEMDVSSLQLLCSVHRTSVRSQKQLRFSNGLPPVALQTALDAGFVRQTGCPMDVGNTCLWIMEKA